MLLQCKLALIAVRAFGVLLGSRMEKFVDEGLYHEGDLSCRLWRRFQLLMKVFAELEIGTARVWSVMVVPSRGFQCPGH